MQKYLIKTDRLGLRFITKEDIHYLEELDNDPEVKEYFPSGTLDRKELQQLIEDYLSNCKHRNLPAFVVFRRDTEQFVGRAYFDHYETGEVKIGYLFHKNYWDKGYASEILCALLDWAKKNIDADYIIAYADKDNKASFRVMEKCGMTYYKDGTYKGMKSKFYRIKNQE
ncbi:GNAT family N-acetyltransferase [Legionella oakridgensis]|uniref:Acetyltransferase, including N-acetylases of ribosomal protein n=2 Tax=Legionella oakridgensis TaxID=29423 RepID=W0BBB0_9GAMM|nr:GNAT family N-acetyltransferase [Legionella oakridgensis]AHE67150.1 acetyltransferase, including N-acetylases of ribosomal protein [Legionella oakridgensis ATCC 33761 = DSM 21215]ETO93121.1 acetyltransferase, including N-acetylase of ribosomal protein [Legionella oakridgensis RV-2-2007]KTD38043.1 GNAT family acetyltransferase [Legionella oakridgensis]STY20235.1 GNAT family acetyltransferase [Legionella longbeachae]